MSRPPRRVWRARGREPRKREPRPSSPASASPAHRPARPGPPRAPPPPGDSLPPPADSRPLRAARPSDELAAPERIPSGSERRSSWPISTRPRLKIA